MQLQSNTLSGMFVVLIFCTALVQLLITSFQALTESKIRHFSLSSRNEHANIITKLTAD